MGRLSPVTALLLMLVPLTAGRLSAQTPAAGSGAGPVGNSAAGKSSVADKSSSSDSEQPAFRGSPAANRASSPRLRFRRVLVPEDRIAEMARGHMPLNREAFRQHLAEIRGGAALVEGTVNGRVREAQYYGRIDGAGSVAGRARLTLTLTNEGPALISLAPSELAIGVPSLTPAASTPVHLGMGADDGLCVHVPGAGDLEFPWSLQGQAQESGSFKLSIQIPPSASNRLWLDVPDNFRLASETGLLTRLGSAPLPDPPTGVSAPFSLQEAGNSSQLETPIAPPDSESSAPLGPAAPPAGHQRWLWELGGANRANLQVVADSLPAGNRPIELRQQTLYEVSPSGLEVTVDVRLDVAQPPCQRLTFLTEPGLQIKSVLFRSGELDWTSSLPGMKELPGANGLPGVNGKQRVVVEFPEPVSGPDLALQIKALAPLVLGKPQRLPTLRPQEPIWREGTMQLRVADSLVVSSLATIGCRESASETSLAPRAPLRRVFPCYLPSAGLVVQVDRRQSQHRIRSGTALEVEEDRVRAEFRSRFEAVRGDTFRLLAEFPSAWAVDRVRLVPPEMLASYDVSAVANSRGQRKRLTITLNQALSRDQPLELQIEAHRASRPRRPLGTSDFQLWQFADALSHRRIVSVRAGPQYRLRLANDLELQRLGPDDLTTEQRQLVGNKGAGGLLFLDDDAADSLTITPSLVEPRFDVDIRMSAMLVPGSLTETYRLSCQPDSGALQQLHVHLSTRRESPVRWSIEGPQDATLSGVRRGEPDPDMQSGGEIWSLDLNRPLAEPFVVVGRRLTPLDGAAALSLAAVHAAASQTGELEIHAAAGRTVQFSQQQLTVLPNEALSWNETAGSRVRLRYEPSRGGSVQVQLDQRDDAGQGNAALWAWNYQLNSYISQHGEALHRLVVRLENGGVSHVRFHVAPGIVVRQVNIDGRRLPPTAWDFQQEKLQLELPDGKRFPLVVLEYATPTPRLNRPRQLRLPRLLADFPVLDRQWQVWLPAPYQLASPSRWFRWSPAEEPGIFRRLFGPLAASSASTSWWAATADQWLGRDFDESPEMRALLGLLNWNLAQRLRPSADRPFTWGELLSDCGPRLRQHKLRLLVDAVAWNNANLEAGQELTAVAGHAPDAAGRALLERHGLLVLGAGQTLILTTVATRSQFRDSLQSTPDPLWDRVRENSELARRLDASSSEQGRFLEAATWSASSLDEHSAWHVETDPDAARLAAAGWTAFPAAIPAALPNERAAGVLECTVYRGDLVEAGGWIAMLLSAGLLVWCFRGRPTSMVLPMGLAGAVAVAVPPPLVPLAGGVFLGAVTAGLAVMIWGHVQSAPAWTLPAAGGARSGTAGEARRAVGLLVLWTVALSTVSLPGQEPPTNPKNGRNGAEGGGAAAEGKVYRVLVPVDEQQQPTGEHDFLPLPFYEKLLLRSAAATATPKGWLIESAEYGSSVNLESNDDEAPLGSITATFQLQTFDADQRVHLKLGRRHVELLSAQLDGVPLQLAWHSDGNHLEVPVSQPGSHKLQIELEPLVREAEGRRFCELRIPPLARSRLNLRVFGDPRRIEIPGARGGVQVDQENQLVANLGPTDRLRIQWSPLTPPETATDLSAEQLLWLRVKPYSVVIEGQFRLTARSGQIEDVVLLADPRLRLLRMDPPLEQRPLVTRGERQSLRLRFAESSGRDITFRASFIMDHSSGVGNIALPELAVVADRTTRRWLAVTVAETLQLDAGGELADASSVPPKEFQAAWGGDVKPPDMALRLEDPAGRRTLSTRFREQPTTLEQETRLSVGQKTIRLRYEAALTNQSGIGFQRQLRIPAGLEVRAVKRLDGMQEANLEFVLSGPRMLTVFLGQAEATTARLVLLGQLAPRGSGGLPLPVIQVNGARVVSDTWRIYRRPSARVEVEQLRGLTQLEASEDAGYEPGWGRLALALSAPPEPLPDSSPVPTGRLRIQANVPRQVGRLLATLRRGGGQWEAEIDYHVEVQDGLVDAVRIQIPPDWTQPWQFDRELQYEVRTVPGTGRRQLIVYPPQAVEREFRFRVRGGLTGYPSESDGVPDFEPLDVDEADRLVIVPTRLEQHQIEWIPNGLQAVALPEERKDLSPEEFAAYRVVGSRPRATIRQVKSNVDIPQVRLADVSIGWNSTGDCGGVVVFDLEPASQSNVVLHVPAPYELVHARVAGRPAHLNRLDTRNWSLQLGPDQLPQRIEVLFRGRLELPERDMERWTVSAPRLVNVPVERTVWTLRTTNDPRRYTPGGDQVPASPLWQEALRMNSLAAVIDGASTLLGDRAQQEIDNWYQLWAPRWIASRNRVEQLGRLDPTRDQYDPRRIAESDRQQEEIAQRLKATALWEAWRQTPPPVFGATEAWRQEGSAAVDFYRRALVGAADTLDLSVEMPSTSPPPESLALAAALLLAAIFASFGFSREILQGWVAQWPHVWGVLLGLAWWLFLWPGFVGWLIVGFSLLGVFRRPWKAVHQSGATSTVVRREPLTRL